MAPKKFTATGEDDGCPALRLIMEKGPLSSQTNGFRLGSLIYIGRLVRGNTLSVKDVGISSKHLLSQADALSDTGPRRWTVTDLDSSNGTILNGSQLKPSEPVVLSDGDVIKIGEQTSIRVKYEDNEVVNDVSSGNVKRNARRRGRNQVGGLGVIDENSELGFVNNEDGEKNTGVAEVEVKQGSNVSTRRTRSSKNNDMLKDLNLIKKNYLSVIGEDSELANKEIEKIDVVPEVKVKEVRNVSIKRTRRSTKNENNLNLGGDKDLRPSEVKGSRGVSVRRTGSSRKFEDADEIGIDLSVIEGNRTRKGARGRKRLAVEKLPEETEKEECRSEYRKFEEEKSRLGAQVKEFAEGINSGKEGTAAGSASTSGAKESNVDSGNETMVADLEMMTLGEWFEFLEVYLPKQIIDETEEMISEMKRKAEKFHDFMLQQKNAKGK